MPVYINVTASLISVSGLDRLRIGDLYASAPDYDPDLGEGLRTCGANLLHLHERHPDAIWHDPGNRLVEARAFRYMQRIHSAEPGEYELAFPFKVPCRPYQLKLFTHARHLKTIALAPVALGTGKSKMALDIAADKFLRGEIDGLAIIAPNGIHRQWIEQAVPEHMCDRVPCAVHIWKPRTRIDNRVMHEGETYRCLRIMAFNVEAFSTESGLAAEALKAFLRTGRIMLVLDESTRIKNYKTQRTKTILRLAPLATVRAILTGTPITKGLEDFFTQYQFLDENIIGLRNYFAFRGRYCITRPVPGRAGGLGALQIVGYREQEDLIRRIAPVSFMIPSTVLNLPPRRTERIIVDLTPEQQGVYAMLRDQLVEDLQANRIENPMNALTRLLRLQQVLCGRWYETMVDDDEFERAEPRRLANNRPAALANALEAHDGQALIWCRFKADVADITEALDSSKNVGVIEGSVPPAERFRQIAAFKAGDLDYMILNLASGSTGLDGLQCCNAAFYYSNTFDREKRWQSEGRIYRLGQHHSTLFGDFIVPGTVDELILQAYEKTADLARAVMSDPHMLHGAVLEAAA